MHTWGNASDWEEKGIEWRFQVVTEESEFGVEVQPSQLTARTKINALQEKMTEPRLSICTIYSDQYRIKSLYIQETGKCDPQTG